MIIGLMGKKRSGKDTVGRYLVEKYNFQRYAFADALKRVALESDPVIELKHWYDRDRAWFQALWDAGDTGYARLSLLVYAMGWERAKEIEDVREYLKKLGVAVRSHVGLDVWVQPVFDVISIMSKHAVITDVRFSNEARRVKEHGGLLVRVVRPALKSDDDHVSETALDCWPADAVLVNEEGDLDGLYRQVDKMLTDRGF